MITAEQAEVVAFLTDPLTHGVARDAISTIETHISVVVVGPKRVFKLKRAVLLPYLDFSSVALRLEACERELRLNRRTAPTLYRGVRRITRDAGGSLTFDGPGPIVDAVVEMDRFDQSTLFDRMAQEGRLSPALLTLLAGEIAAFHAAAAVDLSDDGAANIAGVLDIDERALARLSLFSADAVQRFNAAFRAGLARHAPLLEARARGGKLRHCHGDLHLRNICLVDGRPTLFDCLEFDDRMATIDVLYDLAFLLMDLWHRGLPAAAALVLNRYCDARDETDGLPLLPFFMAIRAAVRAHVGATQAEAATPADRSRMAREAEDYFALALALLEPRPPRLVAIGGFSGSGKSTVAAAIADAVGPPPGARLLASDRLRKARFGVAAETPLPDSAYRPDISDDVYRHLGEAAAHILGLGHGVVADAVFAEGARRHLIAATAAEAGVAFTGLWLEAPAATLTRRVAERHNDASDATVDILLAQMRRDPGPIDWIRIEAGGTAAETAHAARRIVLAEGAEAAGEKGCQAAAADTKPLGTMA